MTSIVNRIVVLLITVALSGVLALGKTIEKEITFNESVTVNGTLVKKGKYKVAFNDETGELTISKGKKVLATTQGRLEKTTDPNSFYTHGTPADPKEAPALVNVSLKDGNLITIVSDTARQ